MSSINTNPPDITNNNNVISGGDWVAELNNTGKTIYVSGTKVVSGPVNLWNANLTISSGAVVSGLVSVATFGNANGTIYVSSGGTIESSYTANGYLNIYSGGSSLSNSYESEVTNIYSGGSSTDDVFTESYSGGYTSGTLNGSKFTGGDNISYVTVSNGGYISNPKVVNESLTVYNAATFESSEACFLAGSLITAPSGLVPVEELSVGDQVIAYVDGIATPRRVIWAGQARCNVRSHLPDDKAGYPVRILKDSIADGVPFKDMLITAEHCLFFDGRFVPSRILVNGRSIFFDKSITSYDYYHIETEDHSVIMANGMLTESYLDTGNRRTFSQKGNIVSIGSSRNLTWDDAAAPLGVSREFAEPLFRKIEGRADKADIAIRAEARPLTNESALHLITDTGVPIRPAREYNGRIMFMIPAGVQSIRIASNASRPSDVIGPFVDDRRYFGVAVGDITLFEGNRSRAITAHLTDGELDGWNTLEWEDCRWTSGNGLLPLGERNPKDIALIAIQIRKTGPYLLTDTPRKEDAMRA